MQPTYLREVLTVPVILSSKLTEPAAESSVSIFACKPLPFSERVRAAHANDDVLREHIHLPHRPFPRRDDFGRRAPAVGARRNSELALEGTRERGVGLEADAVAGGPPTISHSCRIQTG